MQLQEQIEHGIFTSLKPYFFDKFGTLFNFEEEGNSNFIENNFGATMKYQIIDGRSRKRLKFGDHDTPLCKGRAYLCIAEPYLPYLFGPSSSEPTYLHLPYLLVFSITH